MSPESVGGGPDNLPLKREPSFDLLSRPWIPVRDLRGHSSLVGLRTALVEAEQWLDVHAESPLVTVSIYRLLLAILQRAMGPLADSDTYQDWLKHWAQGTWGGAPVEAYLADQRDRFDLFHPDRPFMQVPRLGIPEGSWVPVTVLGLEFASGNNDTLFDHHHELVPVSWPPDQVARYLITAQAFALGGGKSSDSSRFGKHPYRSNGPCVGRVTVLTHGRNLFETLALNLVSNPSRALAGDSGALDRPFWEVPPAELPGPGLRPICGVADYLSWASRAILLHPDPQGLVGRLEMTSLHALPPREHGWFDPWALHVRSDEPPLERAPVPLRTDRALWRDSHALVPDAQGLMPESLRRLRQLRSDQVDMGTVRVHAFGLANDKAKALAWRHDVLPIPRSVLRDADRRLLLEEGLADVQMVERQLRRAIRSLAERLLSLGGTQQPRPDDVTRMVEHLGATSRFWSRLDEPFLAFLAGLGGDAEPARLELARRVRSVARDVFESTSDGCLGRGRRELRARGQVGSLLRALLRSVAPGATDCPTGGST